ncbi:MULTISPECIES: hypothetical protein [Novosphingopyxis]|uniref:hypothetical protein n=1 Tax=Novosphingopyxis TaxID=2709686 RepID=UPI0016512F07|nr:MULTISPECIES: hypothetical protein [Novosphingopyxis]MBH9536582.1 hypothetical protein [Novosphingopyxis sp. YJ-S2-01]|tara:strand:+ start:23 stop:184 length:162 start_codon:yes stop_codon:yes gene_type:complete
MKKSRDDVEAPEAVNTEQQEAGQAQDVAQDALDRHNQFGHESTDEDKPGKSGE